MASTSLRTSAMAFRDYLTYKLHGRNLESWELEGMAHPVLSPQHRGEEADREQCGGVLSELIYHMYYLSHHQPVTHICWTQRIVLKQVLFTATAAQLCFSVVS